MHIDASDLYDAAVLTQMPCEDIGKPQGDQQHEPLAFSSCEFPCAIFKWSTFEEAFVIVFAMARLVYFAVCGSTCIYTDHNNVIFIYSFDPNGNNQPCLHTCWKRCRAGS